MSGGAVVAGSDTVRGLRAGRGLRTLEYDIAEVKKGGGSGVARASGGALSAVPKPPTKNSVPNAPHTNNPPPNNPPFSAARGAAIPQRQTNYSAELERLAQKYIPEKQAGNAVPNTATKTQPPPPGALKSFEMNKEFNKQLHARTELIQTEGAAQQKSPSLASSLGPIKHSVTEKEPQQTKSTEAQPPSETKISTPPTPKGEESKTSVVASQDGENKLEKDVSASPEKQTLGLIAQDIAEELEEVLKKNDKGSEELEKNTPRPSPTTKKDPVHAVPRRSSIQELEATLSDISLRKRSGASRIETYKNETQELEQLLKNLYEKRDTVSKHLEPIQVKEREVLSAIKELEEKERATADKIEKREAETKRWGKEAERRELEDERWRLEEISEKLRSVLERIERERDSIQKKLGDEEKHRVDLEAEERVVRTHRDLLIKENELEGAQKKQKKLENDIANLKETLRTVRAEEEKLENRKRELEIKSEALSDIASRRSLEKDRRTVEDNLHTIEEKRWKHEDMLRKVSDEKDEKDRVIGLLSSERDSLRNAFEGLKKDGVMAQASSV
jgi:hypothetical protein